MDPLRVYITLEVFVHLFAKSDHSMHWIFQRSLKSGKVKIYFEKDLLLQIPCFAVWKEGGKVNGLIKLLVPEPEVEQGFLLSGVCSSATPWCALGVGGGWGGRVMVVKRILYSLYSDQGSSTSGWACLKRGLRDQ